MNIFLLASTFLVTGQAYSQTNTAVANDPQAVAILNQVIAKAGGATLVNGLQDFTGSGQITYDEPESVSGGVTVRGTVNEQFRIDSNLPSGVEAEAITAGSMSTKNENGNVTSFYYQVPVCPERIIVPYFFLRAALNGINFAVTFKGTTALANTSGVEQIEVKEVFPNGALDQSEYRTVDLFIDPQTLVVVMMQDTIPNELTRQVSFSDFQTVGGLSVPFTITETIGETPNWTIQLSQIAFNTGLQDSAFNF